MTAVVQVNEQYTKEFYKLMETLPKQAIKLTVIKNNLNEELLKRITQIKNNEVETTVIKGLSSLRERYVQH